jgi:hypothetical protein
MCSLYEVATEKLKALLRQFCVRLQNTDISQHTPYQGYIMKR